MVAKEWVVREEGKDRRVKKRKKGVKEMSMQRSKKRESLRGGMDG